MKTILLQFSINSFKVERWDLRGVTFLNINNSKTWRETLFISVERLVLLTLLTGLVEIRRLTPLYGNATTTINNLVNFWRVSLERALATRDIIRGRDGTSVRITGLNPSCPILSLACLGWWLVKSGMSWDGRCIVWRWAGSIGGSGVWGDCRDGRLGGGDSRGRGDGWVWGGKWPLLPTILVPCRQSRTWRQQSLLVWIG